MNIAENSKYLNWKCIDNFEKVSDNKIFYNCKDITLSERQRVICKEEFGKIKSKFGPILSEFVEEARGKKKTHLKIAGGNYTFFFTLPKIVEWIRSQFPFLGIEINLFERSGKEEGDKDLDFILTSESKTIPSTALEKLGYYKTRQKIWDGMFFASSEESVKNFKGKENVLKNQDILFGRIYATETSKEQNKKIYLPQGRRNFTPRVIVDQFFSWISTLAKFCRYGGITHNNDLEQKYS